MTLQGLVNRGAETELFLLHAPWDEFWLGQLQDKGYIEGHEALTPAECLEAWRDVYECVYVADPAVPASTNVACMLASLEGGLVAMAGHLPDVPAGTELIDLHGRWRTNAEAIEWALDELWPRMDHGVLGIYHPDGTGHMLRDYLVRNQIFHMWVSGKDIAADSQVADHEAELALLRRLYAESPVNIPVIGFPFSGPDPGLSEYPGIGLAGEYGKLSVPCDFAGNLSVLSGVPAQVTDARARYHALARRPLPALRQDAVYLCIVIIESGDAPSYLINRQYTIWADPARRSVPINWAMGPAVMDVAPPVAEHYLEQATPLDHIFLGLSGAAYVHPFRDFMAKTPDPEAAWEGYLSLTGEYMARLGCHEVGLYTDAWRPYERAIMDPTASRFVDGIPELQGLVMGMGRDEGMTGEEATYLMGESEVAVAHVRTRWPLDYAELTREENIEWLVKDIRDHTPTARPAFVTAMALSWCHDPSSIREVCDRLGEAYVPVLLPEYGSLFRQLQGGAPAAE